jgi:predicted P-loop ATPase
VTSKGCCSCSKGAKCNRTAKHPRVKNGLKEATTDAAAIKKWWKKWPDANIGIRTGDGLAVIDIDPDKGGDDTFVELELRHGSAPDTLTVLTGGDGVHLYFKTDKKVRSTVGDEGHGLGPGLDTRGEGGYVVAPPSNHESGKSYQWDLGSAGQLAELPNWLLPPIGGSGDVKPAYKLDSVDAVIGDRRNVYLASVAGRLRHDGLSETVLQAAIMAENFRRCRPPLDEKEVEGIAKSIAKYPPAASRDLTSDVKPDWWSLLRLTGKDGTTVKKSPGNAAVLLCHRDEWQGVLRYNDFADRVEWVKSAPEGGGPGRPMAGDHLKDGHIGYVGHWLCRYTGPDFTKDAIAMAIDTAARENTVHPAREYFDSLVWDGFDRVGDWLTTYLGVERTDYSQAVGQWWMVSAIARIMRPGCQADHMLVLEGPQGIGKSASVRILAGPWYLGSLPDLRSKDCGHALQGNWIVEVGELDAFRGVGATRVKDYLSQVYDSYRPAYARLFVRRPRQCVFLATTNEDTYLEDATGGRRFWPVKATRLKRELLVADRDQLWAEAIAMYKSGAQWWPTRDLAAPIAEEQESRNRADPWEDKVERYVHSRGLSFITTIELLCDCITMDAAHIELRHQKRIFEIMKQQGWIPTRRYIDGTRQRGFFKGSKHDLEML